MSQEYKITDLENRKVDVAIGPDGSVRITKQWTNPEAQGWFGREMILNRDEWDKIHQLREAMKKK